MGTKKNQNNPSQPSAAGSKKRVQFDLTNKQIHEVEKIVDERERRSYWYTQLDLQAMLVKAIASAGQAVEEARKNNGEMPSLRGLEPLSKTSKDRKDTIVLDNVRVIQAYSKQKRQTGSVDPEKIRKLYQKFTQEDTKRALAYGKMDYEASYSYKPGDAATAAVDTNKPTKKTGFLGFLFRKKNKTQK